MKQISLLAIATLAFSIGSVLGFQTAKGNDFSPKPGASIPPASATHPPTSYLKSSAIVAPTSSVDETLTYTSPLEYVQLEIASNDVVIFSTTFCRHCAATKQLFQSMGVKPTIVELDLIGGGLKNNGLAQALLDLTGQRTVPNVFIKGKHLGGNDTTQEAALNGKLFGMLRI